MNPVIPLNNLVARYALRENLSEEAAKKVVTAFFETIEQTLAEGDAITVRNLGTFVVNKGRLRFIADSMFAATVNEPFEMFSPMALATDFDISAIEENAAENESAIIDTVTLEQEPEVVVMPETDYEPRDEEDNVEIHTIVNEDIATEVSAPAVETVVANDEVSSTDVSEIIVEDEPEVTTFEDEPDVLPSAEPASAAVQPIEATHEVEPREGNLQEEVSPEEDTRENSIEIVPAPMPLSESITDTETAVETVPENPVVEDIWEAGTSIPTESLEAEIRQPDEQSVTAVLSEPIEYTENVPHQETVASNVMQPAYIPEPVMHPETVNAAPPAEPTREVIVEKTREIVVEKTGLRKIHVFFWALLALLIGIAGGIAAGYFCHDAIQRFFNVN